jgi:DNA-binding NtrC family response regulator
MGRFARPTALVVEDDEDQRWLVSMLLEECDMHVVECASGETATAVLDHVRDSLTMVFIDVNLAGDMNGVELATLVRARYPHVAVVLTSGSCAPDVPADMVFMQKPWRALDVLRIAESSRH